MRYGDRLAEAVRMFLLAAYTAELMIESGKWLLGHRRDLRARRVAACLALLQALSGSGNEVW